MSDEDDLGMDGAALLTPKMLAKILAIETFSTAIAAELETLRPGAIDRIAAAASKRVERTIAEETIATTVVEQISHFALRARQAGGD